MISTLIHLPTLLVYCNHFTLGNPKKSFFTVVFIQTSDYYVISEETNCNCCTAAYLHVLLLLFTASYYLCSPILWSFLYLWSVIFKATNANPQPALFRATDIWRNATTVRFKSFTFYKVVWLHFSGVVGKGVTVFFLRKRK